MAHPRGWSLSPELLGSWAPSTDVSLVWTSCLRVCIGAFHAVLALERYLCSTDI